MMHVRARMTGARGQAAPLVVMAMIVALVAVVAIARLGGAADDAARARTAADAAALAGATDGRAAARDMAAANGGELVSYTATSHWVEVVVQVGDGAARARAEVTVTWVR